MNEGLITGFSSEFKLSVRLESQAMKIRKTVMSLPRQLKVWNDGSVQEPDQTPLRSRWVISGWLRPATQPLFSDTSGDMPHPQTEKISEEFSDEKMTRWSIHLLMSSVETMSSANLSSCKTAMKSWQTQQASMACCSDSNPRHSLLKNHLPMVIDEPSNSHNHLTSAFRLFSGLISPWSSSTWTLNCITESAKMLTDQCWRWKISMIRIWSCAVIYSDRLTTDRSGWPELLPQGSCLR